MLYRNYTQYSVSIPKSHVIFLNNHKNVRLTKADAVVEYFLHNSPHGGDTIPVPKVQKKEVYLMDNTKNNKPASTENTENTNTNTNTKNTKNAKNAKNCK